MAGGWANVDHRKSVINPNTRPSYMDNGNPPTPGSSPFDCRVRKRLSDEFNDFAADERETIKTYLRVRPTANGRSGQQNKVKIGDEVFVVQDDKTLLIRPPVKQFFTDTSESTFSYSQVFGPNTSQVTVYEECVRKIVNGFFEDGNSGLIFSYGATNSGKTYTMQGYGKDFGIIPRTLEQLFGRVGDCLYKKGDIKPHQFNSHVILDRNTQKANAETRTRVLREAKIKPSDMSSFMDSIIRTSSSLCSTLGQPGGISASSSSAGGTDDESSQSSLPDKSTLYSVWVSFAEIYNERVYDLLDVAARSKPRRRELKILQDKQGNVYTKDLTECYVNSAEEAYQFFLAGKQNLQFAATNMNSTSSRSHSFFNIRMVVIGKIGSHIYPKEVRRFSFCDLAGLERSSQTGNVGSRLKESGTINQSLLVLLRCIRALRDKQKGVRGVDIIPYRDSKLTRLFQSYLTSATQISMIVNINPDPEMIESTIQVIQNSAIASAIRTFKKIEPPCNDSRFYRKVRMSIRIQREDSDEESSDDTPVPTIKRRQEMPPPDVVVTRNGVPTERMIENRVKDAEDAIRGKLKEEYDRLLAGQREHFERLMKLEQEQSAISNQQRVNLAVAAVTEGFFEDNSSSEESSGDDWGDDSPNVNVQNGGNARRHTVGTPTRRIGIQSQQEKSREFPEDSMKAEIETLLVEIRNLRDENSDLVETVHALSAAKAEKSKMLKSSLAENDELTVKLSASENELRTVIEVKDKQILALRENHLSLQNQKVEDLIEQLDRSKAYASGLERDLKDAENVCMEYDSKLLVANNNNQQLTKDLNDLNHKYLNQEQDKEMLHVLIDNQMATIEKLKSELESLRAPKSPVFLKPHPVYGSFLHSPKTSPSSPHQSERPRRVTAKYSMNGGSSSSRSSRK